MNQHEKRRIAALCGVAAYIQSREGQETKWTRSGKEYTMKNRQLLQIKMFNRRES